MGMSAEELKTKFSQIRWKNFAGSRDRLIHCYFGVNLDIVWNIIKQKLPEIILQLEEILKIQQIGELISGGIRS